MKQRLYAGAFVTPDHSFSNAYVILSENADAVERMKGQLENHTGCEWNDESIYNQVFTGTVKQKTVIHRMIAIIETRNSIPDDEFDFIRIN
ncbi:hypothetical protein ACKC5Q_05120 [Aeromonas dhakensis]|uniref:hypothetical protein n=1 Tax=Aeromonas dhakensis TaxID=196024 RepID=UPI0038B4A544